MATNEHTQALLDEVAEPSFCDWQEVEAALVGILPVLEKCSQQAAAWQSAAQRADIVEESEGLSQQMDNYIQKGRTIKRICAEIEKQIRSLSIARRSMRKMDQHVRTLAAEEGYTDKLSAGTES